MSNIELKPTGKDLYRSSTELGRHVERNVGRVQQNGTESYCLAFSQARAAYAWLFSGSCIGRRDAVEAEPEEFPVAHSGWWFEPVDFHDYVLRELQSPGPFARPGRGYPEQLERPEKKPADFIQHANRLDKHGRIDAALDLIYEKIDSLLRGGDFAEVDSILSRVETKSLSVDLLLGLLTSTLPARTKLPSRREFFARVEGEITERGELEDGLLTGLEG